MQFHHGMCVLAVLAESPVGRSVGELEEQIIKRYFASALLGCKMTRSQVSSCVKNLKKEGYVTSEKVAYRPNMDKVIYRITDEVAVAFAGILESYNDMEKQLSLLPVVHNLEAFYNQPIGE